MAQGVSTAIYACVAPELESHSGAYLEDWWVVLSAFCFAVRLCRSTQRLMAGVTCVQQSPSSVWSLIVLCLATHSRRSMCGCLCPFTPLPLGIDEFVHIIYCCEAAN